jgi:hypothetical protein
MNFKNDTNIEFDLRIQYRKPNHKSDQYADITLQPNTDNTVASIDENAELKMITATDNNNNKYNIRDLINNNKGTIQMGGYYRLWVSPQDGKFSAEQYSGFLNFKNSLSAPVTVTYESNNPDHTGESITIPSNQFGTLHYKGSINLLKFVGPNDAKYGNNPTYTRIVNNKSLSNFINQFKNNNNKYAEITKSYDLDVKNK